MKFFLFISLQKNDDDGTVELIIQFPAVLTLKPIQSMGHREMATGNCFGFFSKKIHFIFFFWSNMLSNRFIFHLTYIQMYYKEISHLFCTIFFFCGFIHLSSSFLLCQYKKLFNNILPLSVNSSTVIHLLWQMWRSKNQL